MPANLTTIINIATRELRDQASHYSTAQLQSLAEDVIENEFSLVKPQITVKDVTGNGTQLYAISLLGTNWEEGFSQIRNIHFPIDDDDPSYLTTDAFVVEKKTDDTYRLRFVEESPSTSESFRVAFTNRHVVDTSAGTTTVPVAHERAAGLLVAYQVLDTLSNEFAQLANVDLGGKMRLNYMETSKRLEARAKVVREKYIRALSYGMVAARARPLHRTVFFKHG